MKNGNVLFFSTGNHVAGNNYKGWLIYKGPQAKATR